MIILENINKYYGQLQVLKDINVAIADSSIVAITGPSGAGKTTMLQIMGSLSKPDSGKVFIDNTDVNDLSNKKLADFRNKKLGFVFQFHNLLPEFTAVENVMIPALIAGMRKTEAQKKAMELVSFFGLENRSSHNPTELSGGEQQRIAIARAMMNQPALLLADEPSGNLDTENAEELHKCFLDLRDQYKQTIVLVTHNLHLAQMADRIIEMKDGEIVQQ
jgi:lipoprotein-releasing system ATP-binding protein